MSISDDRQGYIDGLRTLADVLEQHPEIELPSDGTRLPLGWNLWGEDAREQMAAIARAVPCKWAKSTRDEYFDLSGTLGRLNLKVTAYRNAVCTRRVVGTEEREVEEEITPAVIQKVVKQVEVVEWTCEAILPAAREDGES